jgi:hypothetical protein
MAFVKESSRYHKTILSDLQGAWQILRHLIVENAGFEGWERAIFHVDEAMSWEIVRNLKDMPPLILIIRNICIQGKANSEIIDSIENLTEILNETFEVYTN